MAKHWRRLSIDADRLGIDISDFDDQTLVKLLAAKLREAKLINGRARITFTDERAAEIWSASSGDSEMGASVQIVVGGSRHIPPNFQLTISPFPVNSRSPLAGVKSCNYLEQILSLNEAKGRVFHEAVRVNERGHVTSGCMSNVFWLKDDRLYTPTLATGCLAGTTREYVLENVECEEVEAEIGELESADAIYLTSAGLGIVRVAEFDGRELPDTKHPIQNLWPPS